MQYKRYERKDQSLSKLIGKIKLWPSRTGLLHGIKTLENKDGLLIITTHCGEQFVTKDSRSSRSSRWLRNRFVTKPCPKCKVPEWKLEKYSKTEFR